MTTTNCPICGNVGCTVCQPRPKLARADVLVAARDHAKHNRCRVGGRVAWAGVILSSPDDTGRAAIRYFVPGDNRALSQRLDHGERWYGVDTVENLSRR